LATTTLPAVTLNPASPIHTMENPPTAKELPPAPLLSEPSNISKISRSRTTPVDLDTMDSSGRSNGRSSIDSTSERPKSQSGEAADTARAGPSGFSKLLRRKKNKKNQKQTDEQLTDNDRDISGSRDGDYAASLFANDNNALPENEAGTLLADDFELDRWVFLLVRTGVLPFFFFFLFFG